MSEPLLPAEDGVTNFEKEFLPYMVLSNGKTIADSLLPKINELIKEGKNPSLCLPEFVEKQNGTL